MLNINKMISRYNHYDYNKPKFIAIHYVGAQSSTAKNNAIYFNNGDRQASAHYFVDNNEIWQSVEELNGAWHIGNTRTEVNNQNSIGIEQCCMGDNLMVTEQTEKNTIELVKHLMSKYNIPIENVRTHYTISGNSKVCPNWSVNGWSRFTNFKNKISNIQVPPSTPQQPNSDVIYRVKLANGEQLGAYRNLESAKSLAQVNKCNVIRSTDNVIVASYLPNTNPISKPINYRVKRKNGEQLGAFGSLDNAKSLAQQEKAIVYDSNNNIVISYIPVANLGYVNLKPHMNSWRVYPVDGAYTSGNEVGNLAPSQFGGISYQILEEKAKDVYKIKTDSYGIVAIYVPVDEDSTFTQSPVYGGTVSQPAPAPKPPVSNSKYVNLRSFMTAWRVYDLNSPVTQGYEKGFLNPSLGSNGGLSYKVIESLGGDVYSINTNSFGKVKIYCPNDNEGSVTSSPLYELV